jgi:hypothetical protein
MSFGGSLFCAIPLCRFLNLPITDRGLAQFCGGRCLQGGKPQNKPDTLENIFRMNLGINYVF